MPPCAGSNPAAPASRSIRVAQFLRRRRNIVGAPIFAAALHRHFDPFDIVDVVQRVGGQHDEVRERSEEHTSELQSLMRHSYAVFCLKKNKHINYYNLLPNPTTQLLQPTQI